MRLSTTLGKRSDRFVAALEIAAKMALDCCVLIKPIRTMQTRVSCPYCGEENLIVIDESAGESQDYVEDCQVCCQPWQVTVTLNEDGEPEVDVRKPGD